MFSKILGKKAKGNTPEDAEHAAIVAKISKMNLTDMRSYVKNKMKEFPLTEDGLIEIMLKMTTKDPKSQEYYIKSDDMDSKKKKAFDLVLTIAESKKITIKVVELMQDFSEIYSDIINSYDQENKDIYASRLLDAVHLALANINKKAELKNKMNILGEDG
jgi:hypothetical protein